MPNLNESLSIDNSIETMYEDCKELILNYFSTYTEEIKTKLIASKDVLDTDQQKAIDDLLLKLEDQTYIQEITDYLNNAEFVYGDIEETEELKFNLTISVVPQSDYVDKGSFGTYIPSQEKVLVPETADQATLLHELIHALTFRFDAFFLNQLSLDPDDLNLIKTTIYDGSFEMNIDDHNHSVYQKKIDEILIGYKDLKQNLEFFLKLSNGMASSFSIELEMYFSANTSQDLSRYDFQNWLLTKPIDGINDLDMNELESLFYDVSDFVYFTNVLTEFESAYMNLGLVRTKLIKLENDLTKVKNVFKRNKMLQEMDMYKKEIQDYTDKLNSSYTILQGMTKYQTDEYMRDFTQEMYSTISTISAINKPSDYFNRTGKKMDIVHEKKKDYLDVLAKTIVGFYNYQSTLNKVNHDIKILKMMNSDPGTGYMGSFEIVARFWELRLSLFQAGIIENAGDEITIESIEALLKLKQKEYKNNGKYDLLDGIELDADGKIPADKIDYINTIIRMNNDEVVSNDDISGIHSMV